MKLRHLIVPAIWAVLVSTGYAKEWKSTGELLDELGRRWPEEKQLIAAPVRIDGAGARPIAEQAASLAKLIARAKEEKVSVAVYGHPSAATREVVLKALQLVESTQLKRLFLVFCGAPSDREAVERQVVAQGAVFAFVEFNE